MSQYADPEILMLELDKLEKAISDVNHVLDDFSRRKGEIFAVLETITRPIAKCFSASSTKDIYRGYVYKGRYHSHWSYTDLYLSLLGKVLAEHPDRAVAIAQELARYGTSRTYLAKKPELLFSGKTPSWIAKHSKEICDGWFVDTNLNLERMKTLLPVAVKAAGLNWGREAMVFWRKTTLTENEIKELGL